MSCGASTGPGAETVTWERITAQGRNRTGPERSDGHLDTWFKACREIDVIKAAIKCAREHPRMEDRRERLAELCASLANVEEERRRLEAGIHGVRRIQACLPERVTL